MLNEQEEGRTKAISKHKESYRHSKGLEDLSLEKEKDPERHPKKVGQCSSNVSDVQPRGRQPRRGRKEGGSVTRSSY